MVQEYPKTTISLWRTWCWPMVNGLRWSEHAGSWAEAKPGACGWSAWSMAGARR